MTLEYIDVVCTQTLKRVLNSSEDSLYVRRAQNLSTRMSTHLSTETTVVDETWWSMSRRIPKLEESLGHDDYRFSRDVVGLEELAQDPLGMSLGIGIGRVEGLLVS